MEARARETDEGMITPNVVPLYAVAREGQVGHAVDRRHIGIKVDEAQQSLVVDARAGLDDSAGVRHWVLSWRSWTERENVPFEASIRR